MPALVFLAVAGLVLVALLLVADATLKPVIVTSQRSGPPKPWHPGAIQTLTTAPAPALTTGPAPAPDMTSPAVLAAQPKSAPNALTKIESAAREARAEEPPKKARAEEPLKKTRAEAPPKKARAEASAKKARAEAPPQDQRVTQPNNYQQTPLFERFSIKGY